MPRKAATETATLRNCAANHAASSRSHSLRVDASFVAPARVSSFLRQLSCEGSTVMTTSFGGPLLLAPAMAVPPCFDFLLDVADDVAQLAPDDRLVQDPRAQELLDQSLEPEAQRDHTRDFCNDLRLAPKPRPCDAADPGAAPGLPKSKRSFGTRRRERNFEVGPPVPMGAETSEGHALPVMRHLVLKIVHAVLPSDEKGRRPE